jgi:hypothetical protein
MSRSKSAERARLRAALSRRRFLRLAAAGALALAAPASAAAPAGTRKPAATRPAGPAARTGRIASAREIQKQKGWLADSLKAIRAVELPPGSNPAFVFRPLKPRRRRKEG